MDTTNPDPANIPDDDLRLQNPQDDLDTDDNATDPLMHELNDDPTVTLGVDPEEFKNEIDKYDFDGDSEGSGNDDRREQLEDIDQES